jgi:hypothetical protein
MVGRRKTPAVERIKQAAAVGRRSSLYLWMLKNHDEFAASLAEAGRPNWQAIAEAFGAEGLTDLRNKPPTAEGARQTWFKVRKAVAKAPAVPKPAPASPMTKPQPPTSSPVRTVKPDEEGDRQPQFRLAVPRGMEPKKPDKGDDQ